VLTPHLGYVTEEGFRNHYAQMVEGIDAWFKGEPAAKIGVALRLNQPSKRKRRAPARPSG